MTTLSAGQFMETAEKNAVTVATGQTVTPGYTTTGMALLSNATSGSVDPTWILMSSTSELSGSGYARSSITTSSGWAAATSASPSVISNSGALSWGPVTGSNWSTANWGMLASAVTAGIPLIAYLLTTPRTALVGDTVAGAIGAFTAQV